MRARLDELPRGEGAEYDIYPRAAERAVRRRGAVRSAQLLYQSIGVTREDRAGRYRQYARNFEFFGAPVGLFFASEKQHGPPQWADLGGYIQTVAAAGARLRPAHLPARSLDASDQHRALLPRNFPPNYMIFLRHGRSAMPTTDAPINTWRSPREPLDAFASFEGFEG